MKKILISTAVAMLVVPQIALASWWNPFSWKIFNRPAEVRVEQTHDVNPGNKKATTTATSTVKISQQKEVVIKENKKTVITSPKKQVVEVSTKLTEPVSQVAPKQEEPKTSILTFQNGAIAEIDAKGNVIRWVKEVIVVPSTAVSSVQSQTSTKVTSELSILLRGITNANNSGRFSWRTSVPSNSRLVLYTYGLVNSVAFYSSFSGFSTEHFVEIPDLLLASGSHGYSVEAWDKGSTVVSSTVPFHSQKADGYIID